MYYHLLHIPIKQLGYDCHFEAGSDFQSHFLRSSFVLGKCRF